ncbi:serine/threonine protein kinase [Hokovirus HKV1]|uniref:Serine/threonine protein kinase n=1 Tax=Hokovirus HKV1 TaxID=1977638 RepID=A0A1V0SFQ6_9VIRU|nr:serine/threonine protein kinase [Hokovirus HKV1]
MNKLKRLLLNFKSNNKNINDDDHIVLQKIKWININTLENIKIHSDFYPHILIAKRDSSVDNNIKNTVIIKEYTKINEFITELMIMEKITKINVPIPHVYGVYQNNVRPQQSFCLVMEKINADDIIDHIQQKNLYYNDKLNIIIQLITCVNKLHNYNISHRDIKCENLLVNKINNNVKLTMIDFAVSIIVNNDQEYSYDYVGTRNYFSPELHFKSKYLPKNNDIWSVGVIIYILLTDGYYPFMYDNNNNNNNNINKFYKHCIKNIRYDMIDSKISGILGMIFTKEKKRITSVELCNKLIPILNNIILENNIAKNDIMMSPGRSIFSKTF